MRSFQQNFSFTKTFDPFGRWALANAVRLSDTGQSFFKQSRSGIFVGNSRSQSFNVLYDGLGYLQSVEFCRAALSYSRISSDRVTALTCDVCFPSISVTVGCFRLPLLGF